MRATGAHVRLFSWRNCSTNWSRLMSSLPRLFRDRHRLPSGPGACATARRGDVSAGRSAARGVVPATGGGRSTSMSLPCTIMGGFGAVGCAASVSASPAGGASAPAWSVAVSPPAWAAVVARLDRRDSMYSVLE